MVFLLFSCASTNSEKNDMIKNYSFKNPFQITITSKLNEVSGLTNSDDGNIYAINDEIGIIYKLNPEDGKVIKRFYLGKWTSEGDFEGIAATKDFVYAITSNGTLYKFKEGDNEEAVKFETQKLPFSSRFDIEGLYFDKELNGLLILPKEYAGKKHKGTRVVYFYSLIESKVDPEPIIKISLMDLKKNFSVKDFFPSGISKHPSTGNYYIISARDRNVLVEIDNLGNIIGVKKLKESVHRQPEGITILADNTLIISDEAAGKKPKLTRYTYKE